MNFLMSLLPIGLILLSGGCIAYASLRVLLWLKAELVDDVVPLTGVEQAARYWEAISTYHDLPDGSSVFLAVVTPGGQVLVIKEAAEIERLAATILHYRDVRKSRWINLKLRGSACRPSTDS